MLATVAMVSVFSYSVFAGSTSSPTDTWSTGTVVLKNDSTTFGTQRTTGGAPFTVSNVKSNGGAVVRCITVEYSGSLAADIHLYAVTRANTNSLLSYLNVSFDEVSGATDASCTGVSSSTPVASTSLSVLTTYGYSYDAGYPAWSAPGGALTSRQYRFTIQPDPSMTDAQQNSSAEVEFIWEARNS